MAIETISNVLAWCTTINLALLIFWIIFYTAARDWIYRMHNRWYKISLDQFNAIHYSAMAFYKILFLMFNLIPYLAFRIVY